MKVLVLCEYSGVVRDAFLARGHDAVSCDILPTESPGPHIQADCRTIDYTGTDMVIAHPPCTRLAVSGARYFAQYPQEQEQALELVRWIMALPVPRICVENPVSVISTRIRKPDQIIQPYNFGENERKTTCLWLRGLPPLMATCILPDPGRWSLYNLPPGPDRGKLRSKTCVGIARAMAEQWG